MFILWILTGLIASSLAAPIEIQILHTNDIHSVYEPPMSPEGLGGIARLKTLKDRLQKPGGLFLDAGDFSEGSSGFTADNGFLSYRMMAEMGYDAVAMGNHEWLNGLPAVLERWLSVRKIFPILSANLEALDGSESPLPPYQIFERSGLKIAVLGLSTNELTYQGYLKPYHLVHPNGAARVWVEYLRNEQHVDVVIVLSHLGKNSDAFMAARVPGIDLIVGAHSHDVIQTAQMVQNRQDPAIVTPVVQTGCYGRYLGESVLKIDPATHKVELSSYRLHPVRKSIPEDPAIKKIASEAREKSNAAIRSQLSNDQIRIPAQQNLGIPTEGPSNLANLVADAYREYTKADIGLQLKSNLGGSLLPKAEGWDKFDIFNVLPFIFFNHSQKTWTVHRYTVRVAQFKGYLRYALLYTSDLAVSGIRIIYDPTKSLLKLQDVQDLQGNSLPDDQVVTIASTNVLVDFKEALFDYIKLDLPILTVENTGAEAWDVVFDFLKRKGSEAYRNANVLFNRVIPRQADIYAPPYEIQRKGKTISFPIYNLGQNPVYNGYQVTLWESPLLGEDSDTVSLHDYVLVYDEDFFGEFRGGETHLHEIQIPDELYTDQKRKFVLLISMFGQKESNHMNNFQEFFLD